MQKKWKFTLDLTINLDACWKEFDIDITQHKWISTYIFIQIIKTQNIIMVEIYYAEIKKDT